jgi:uncharacterized protein
VELPHDSTLLRIFVAERDRHGHKPLYEAIVMRARRHGLAGATVLRCLLGYGRSSVVHTAKLLDVSDDLPMVVEIVDTEERIQEFLPALDEMMSSGLITLEKVRVIRYGPPRKK